MNKSGILIYTYIICIMHIHIYRYRIFKCFISYSSFFFFFYSHQFYMHGKLELSEGRLRPTDSQTVCKTIALLAQAEFGDCDNLVALVEFYGYWCEHLDVPVDDDDESIDRIQKFHSEMRVRAIDIIYYIPGRAISPVPIYQLFYKHFMVTDNDYVFKYNFN